MLLSVVVCLILLLVGDVSISVDFLDRGDVFEVANAAVGVVVVFVVAVVVAFMLFVDVVFEIGEEDIDDTGDIKEGCKFVDLPAAVGVVVGGTEGDEGAIGERGVVCGERLIIGLAAAAAATGGAVDVIFGEVCGEDEAETGGLVFVVAAAVFVLDENG